MKNDELGEFSISNKRINETWIRFLLNGIAFYFVVTFAQCYMKNTNKTQIKYNTQSMKWNMN